MMNFFWCVAVINASKITHIRCLITGISMVLVHNQAPLPHCPPCLVLVTFLAHSHM